MGELNSMTVVDAAEVIASFNSHDGMHSQTMPVRSENIDAFFI